MEELEVLPAHDMLSKHSARGLVERILDDIPPVQRRIRHITSIQVRNLTPYPARDALASALSNRAGPSQFSAHGHFSDDTDVAMARRRSRRISTSSINTLQGLRFDGMTEDAAERPSSSQSPNTRKRTSSRTSLPNGSTGSPQMRRQFHTISAGSTPSAKPVRPRTTSHTSLTEPQGISEPSASSIQPTTVSTPFGVSQVPNSQNELEGVIWSRLVETFITLGVLPRDVNLSPPAGRVDPVPDAQGPERDHYAQKKDTFNNCSPSSRRDGPGLNGSPRYTTGSMSGLKGTSTRKREASSPSGSPARRRESRVLESKLSTSSRMGSQLSLPSASPRKMAFPQSPPLTPSPPYQPIDPATPIYMSPFHRPSTNPTFKFDAKDRDFAEWADLSCERVSICIWGRVGAGWGKKDTKGKGKEISPSPSTDEDGGWKPLHKWDLELSDLVPLPEHLAAHPSQLPSNALLLTLCPSGPIYYLPNSLMGHSPVPSRPPSPDYNSDPEYGLSVSKKDAEKDFIETSRTIYACGERGRERRSKIKERRSAGWQDLVKLVTLQACIIDTQESLLEVIRSCDLAIEADISNLLRREVSEREYRIQVIHGRHDDIRDGIEETRKLMERRRQQLQQRREHLTEARAIHEDNLLSEFDMGAKLAEERKKNSGLASRLLPTRTSLLTTLASIFPIDLLSPPDLLFTILSTPLPIPLTSSDPAPPLSLASHSEVTEDSVATALGYAAIVVQLMASYLTRSLVYPITYIGSRSLIKDPISAMMGPRMFPLYSKGVDTYRFEYAVFLLNKDIEMLMADRNLRALDMRHTLPNLKNLLLTLTNADSTSTHVPRPLSSLGLPASLRLTRASSPLALASTSPPPHSSTQLSASAGPSSTTGSDSSATNTPASSLSSTTSTMATFARRPKSYLGLSPLTSMFRARYPSAAGKPTVKAVEETQEGNDTDESSSPSLATSESDADADAADDEDDEDDDRQTIRGVSTTEERSDKPPNGNAHGRQRHDEKQMDDDQSPGTLAPVIQHVS